MNQLKGFVQKGHISNSWPIHFLQDQANFWQTDWFRHEKHRSVIEGLHAKRAYIKFWPIFIFCRIELIFGRLTCFDMESIVPYLFRTICASFSRNNVCKKTQFCVKRHLNERSRFRRDANLNDYF